MASDRIALGAPDYIICFLMVGLSVSIGIYYAVRGKRQMSILQYFIGNRKLGVIPVAISMAVSYMSSGTMVGAPAEVYHYGIPFFVYTSSVVLGNFLSAWICAPLWYELNITSSYQYLDLRYKSRLVRMVGAAVGILQNMIYAGMVLFGSAAAVEAVTGLPAWGTICILGFSTILYTTIGGFTAVIWTDVFQLLVMALGLITICVKTFVDLGSMKEFWDNVVAGKRVRMLKFNPDPTIRTSFCSALIGGTTYWFVMAFSQQGVQRVASMRNLTQAKNTPVFLPLLTVACFEGLAAYAYYAKKRCDPFVEGVISDVNAIMPYFVMELCRNLLGLPGLFMASIFSASISTVSSCLNSISAVALSDFVHPFWPSLTNRRAMWIAKALVVVFGVLSLGISFLTSSRDGPVTEIATVFLGAVIGPNSGVFLLGAFFPWANVKTWHLNKLYAVSFMLFPTLGLLITLLVGLIVSLLSGRTDPADVNPMCISHLIRHRFYKPNPTEKQLDLFVPTQAAENFNDNPKD